MNKGRRIGTAVAAAVAAVGIAALGSGAPAAAAPVRGPQPVSNWLRAVRANTGTWVNVLWQTDRRICDAQVRFDGGPRVRIDYPGPRNFTSFSRGSYLLPGRPDYTAVEVTPYFNRSGIALLRATITYDNCRPHARTQWDSTVLTLPVIRNAGPIHGGPGHGGPGGMGNGGPGDGGPGHGGPGHGGPGDGGPGHGGPGDGGPGHGGPGDGGPGHGGPGGMGQGHDDHDNGHGPGGHR